MRALFLSITLAVSGSLAADVFDMPQLFPSHLHLRRQLMQTLRAGRTDEMERVCREGVALLPTDPTWQYNLACALAYRADKQEALTALERAIKLGFRDPDAIRADSDLKQLADVPGFAELVKLAEKLRGQPVEGGPVVSPALVFMGRPAEINSENTIWDFDAGCFRALFDLRNSDARKLSAHASAYRGPAAGPISGWMEELSAAGNFGDLYMNRDNGHSTLATTNFPGLTPVVYGEEARQRKVHESLPNTLLDYPLIGNCSMAVTGGAMWRSLPRMILTDTMQPVTALRLYLSNQCWFYPSHRDYTREQGDLMPANAPYYVISLGSSYSDKPFMEAYAAAMAAMHPETKRTLVKNNMLAPIMQMLLRSTLKQVKTPADYLTGAAHPVVFDAADLDADAMVRKAHELTPENAPPPVVLRVIKEDQPAAGIEFFDIRPEVLFDTPFCIARVVRGTARKRTMTLEASLPQAAAGLKFHWVVLQGEPDKIELKTLDDNGSKVELSVAYHGLYRPTAPNGLPATRQSSRVDIGCFVRQGDNWSAPSFVSLYYLPHEERVYHGDGRILSIDYANAAHRYADPLLTIRKSWKDLYRYDAEKRLTGWLRMRDGGKPERFTWLGHKVLETDALDRPTKACAVEYLPRQIGVAGMPQELSCAPAAQVFDYTYTGDQDQVGTAAPGG